MIEVLTFSLGKKYYCLLIYYKSLDFVLQLQSQRVEEPCMQIKAAFYFMTGLTVHLINLKQQKILLWWDLDTNLGFLDLKIMLASDIFIS
jgi:hypothetical protein